VRAGELWATRVRWTPGAAAAVAAGEWKYVSPTFITDEDARITELINCALTNLPATKRMAPLVAASKRGPMKTKADYLKALAARDNSVPFYVALPSSTIDWTINDGAQDIEIEERSAKEVTHVLGRGADGRVQTFEITSPGSRAANPAFDVTPARLVTGLVTERGIAAATRDGLLKLFPERAR
jgi:hypothetical protein